MNYDERISELVREGYKLEQAREQAHQEWMTETSDALTDIAVSLKTIAVELKRTESKAAALLTEAYADAMAHIEHGHPGRKMERAQYAQGLYDASRIIRRAT